MSEPKNVVIVGLGLGGMHVINELESSLPASHRIVVISKFDFAYQHLNVRSSVVQGWEDTTIIPLDQVFKKRSNIILGGVTATEVTRNSVRLDKATKEFGHEVPFDILVFATGSIYGFPARVKEQDKTAEDIQNSLRGMQSDIKRAQSILVLGGGAFGVEWAGEVAEAYPGKKVTLVHPHDWLYSPLYKKSMHVYLKKQLDQRGVKVVLNHRVDFDGSTSGPISPRRFDVGNGQSVEADFVFLATGNKANGSLASRLAPDAINSAGYVKVKPTLQIDTRDKSLSRVFATGDVSAAQSAKEMKTGMNAQKQGAVVAKNVVALINGKSLTNFSAPGVMGLVTVGPTGGAAQMFSMVIGAWMARMVKGKDAATGLIYGAYHSKAPKNPPLVKAA